MIHPNYFPQNSEDSIINEKGQYDMAVLSYGERKVIDDVVSLVLKSSKYPYKVKSIGFVNEAYGIKYKPRYILNELIVQIYRNSEEPLDVLAVAFAYLSKGSIGRKNAVAYFDKFFLTADENDKRLVRKYYHPATEPFFSLTLSELYEAECLFDSALEFATQAYRMRITGLPAYPIRVAKVLRKIDIAQCLEFLDDVIETEEFSNCPSLLKMRNNVSDEYSNGYVFKPRGRAVSKNAVEFETAVVDATRKYINTSKLLGRTERSLWKDVRNVVARMLNIR